MAFPALVMSLTLIEKVMNKFGKVNYFMYIYRYE